MNIPRIKNPWRRRLHLLWIVPYIIVSVIPFVVWEGCKETLPYVWPSLREVWTGR